MRKDGRFQKTSHNFAAMCHRRLHLPNKKTPPNEQRGSKQIPAKHKAQIALPSPIQTILSALESHQINRFLAENSSRAWSAQTLPPVGNCLDHSIKTHPAPKVVPKKYIFNLLTLYLR